MTKRKSRSVDEPLSRKRLSADYSTRRGRKDSSPDATSNSDQNVDEIAPSDSQPQEILYQNRSDKGGRISESTPTSPSELQLEQLSTSSVVVSQVGPGDEHPSSESSEASDDSVSEGSLETDSEWGTLREFTISATIETGQAELTIQVPKQRNYTCWHPGVISSSLADIPCATLGVQGVLDQLNVTLRTSHTLDTPSILSVLEDCIVKNYDFGTAYGRLRSVWDRDNDRTIEDELRTREDEDKEQRRKALVGDDIWNLRPRRVWDLYSNRVVPSSSWITKVGWPQPISHAWVDEKDRVNVWTPINGNEWPVPIPKDASLDLIRIEMLNLGAEYTWLDVLCLRQKGGPREDLRMDEWKLDVPTIGQVYRRERVMIYLSGLGRPLSLNEGDLESDRCWFRRAWTLQEVGKWRFIAGDTPDGPLHAKPVDDNGNYETEILTTFHKQLEHMHETTHRYQLFETLADMRKRVSTNPVDRVAGLAHCLWASRAYCESETEEDAWTALVNTMDPGMRGRFLFLYPGVGLGGKKWRPTWEQVMSEPLPADVSGGKCVYHDKETDEDWCEGPCIKHIGFVRGLDEESAEGVDRVGQLVVQDTDRMQYIFKILATHQFPIPEGAYTLLGHFHRWDPPVMRGFWAVGRSLPDQHFEKLSVIRIQDWRERVRLEECGFVEWGLKTYLL